MVHSTFLASWSFNPILVPSLVRKITLLILIHFSLLFYVHIKNYINGKTTNERFSRKAQASFSEEGESGMGSSTYMDGKSESESLMDGNDSRNPSRNSIVIDDEIAKESGKKKSRSSKRVNGKR